MVSWQPTSRTDRVTATEDGAASTVQKTRHATRLIAVQGARASANSESTARDHWEVEARQQNVARVLASAEAAVLASTVHEKSLYRVHAYSSLANTSPADELPARLPGCTIVWQTPKPSTVQSARQTTARFTRQCPPSDHHIQSTVSSQQRAKEAVSPAPSVNHSASKQANLHRRPMTNEVSGKSSLRTPELVKERPRTTTELLPTRTTKRQTPESSAPWGLAHRLAQPRKAMSPSPLKLHRLQAISEAKSKLQRLNFSLMAADLVDTERAKLGSALRETHPPLLTLAPKAWTGGWAKERVAKALKSAEAWEQKMDSAYEEAARSLQRVHKSHGETEKDLDHFYASIGQIRATRLTLQPLRMRALISPRFQPYNSAPNPPNCPAFNMTGGLGAVLPMHVGSEVNKEEWDRLRRLNRKGLLKGEDRDKFNEGETVLEKLV